MIQFLTQPWPWYFGGFMISIILFLLLWTGKSFGMSSNLRTLCSMMGAGKKVSFFDFDWKAQRWNLIVALGVVLGGFIASNYIVSTKSMDLSQNTVDQLLAMGIQDAGKVLPLKFFFPTMRLQTPMYYYC